MFSKLISLFTYLDIYGRNVELYINSYTKVRSKFGAFLSLIILIFSFYLFLDAFRNWIENKSLKIISSSHAYTVSELLSMKNPISFSLDYQNYNLYVSMTARLPNKTTLNYDSLQRYFTQYFYYYGHKGEVLEIPFNKCSIGKQSEFLLQPKIDAEEEVFNNTSCLNEKIIMGLFPDNKNMVVNLTSLSYSIERCKNSTENGNFCVSNDEFYNVLPYVKIQMSIPNSIYDFNDATSPRKRTYNYQFYTLDPYLIKVYNNRLMPVILKTDIGTISDEMELDSIDFNVENVNHEISIKNYGDDLFFAYNFSLGFTELTYYRKNEKIYQIVGNFGGIINILFLLGKIICYYYNMLVMKHKLINMSFENLEKVDQPNL